MREKTVVKKFIEYLQKTKEGVQFGVIYKHKDAPWYFPVIFSDYALAKEARLLCWLKIIETWELNDKFTEADLKRRVDMLNRRVKKKRESSRKRHN